VSTDKGKSDDSKLQTVYRYMLLLNYNVDPKNMWKLNGLEISDSCRLHNSRDYIAIITIKMPLTSTDYDNDVKCLHFHAKWYYDDEDSV
jgi:hypothetical protein